MPTRYFCNSLVSLGTYLSDTIKFCELEVMCSSSAAETSCMALASLTISPTMRTYPQSRPVCAFCGSWTTPCRSSSLCPIGRSSTCSSSSIVYRRVRTFSPTALPGSHQLCLPFTWTASAKYDHSDQRGLLLASTSPWRDVNDGDDSGSADRRSRRTSGNPSAPWEELQWSNVRSAPDPRAIDGGSNGSRGSEVIDDEDYLEEDYYDGEEEYLGLGEQQRPGARSTTYSRYEDGFGDDVDESYGKGAAPRRPTERAWTQRRERNVVEEFPAWNSGWFDDAQQANQSGLLQLAKRFYNALFWYGAASEDREQLPAMNFQDLMERFDAFSGPRPPGASRPIVPPEDLSAEQEYRWRPGRRVSGPEGVGRPRRGPKNFYGGESERRRTTRDGRRDTERDDGERLSVSREDPKPWRRKEAFHDDGKDQAMIGQLRRKQRKLADKEHGLEMDLEKIRERLGVVDATVELWLRRSQAMSAKGGSETDTEMLQAKRRIYRLKEEGRQLDDAKLELEGRLDGCRATLDRVLQELESLGEDAIPFVSFQQPTEEQGTEIDEDKAGGASSPTDAVEFEGVDLAGSKISKEALPVIEKETEE